MEQSPIGIDTYITANFTDCISSLPIISYVPKLWTRRVPYHYIITFGASTMTLARSILNEKNRKQNKKIPNANMRSATLNKMLPTID